ncbi:hypothetical protein [Haliscomenobacter sp.]|uniref:hypothetical protein n=1 Tax=Haliscomenobacter sp. TaxID=2717303 RepID=UPI0033650309
MTQNVIDIGAVPDDGQGDPLRTAFAFTNDNFSQIFESGPVGSNVKIANNTITTTVINSNLILSPSGIGKIQVNNTLLPRIDNVYDLGSLSQRFNTIYVGSGGLDITGGIVVSGNITADYFIGNGSALTGIVATTGSRVENGNSNINIPAAGSNIFVTVNGTGNIVVFSNTGAYVAGAVSATGNITGNYILGNGALLTGINVNYSNANVTAYLPTYTGNLVSLTGPVTTTANVTGANLRTSGQITATGNITGGNVDTNRVNAANITVGGPVSATGNITGNYILGNGALLTGINANYSNANVTAYLPTYTGNLVSLTGPVTTTANVTGANIRATGQITATGNITGGNVDTGRVNAATITASGNVSGAYFLGDGSQLTNLPAGNYSNANVTAYLPTYTGNLVSLAGPVTTTSNITGANIRATGQITATGNVTAGNVDTGRVNAATVTVAGPVSASGNVTGAYFLGDGSQLTNLPAGNYSNANVTAYLPTYTGNLVSLTGPVTTTANITGGNLLTSGQATVTGNITAGNIDVTKVNAVTVTASGLISAVGNITGNNLIGTTVTGTTVTATANVVGGNITTAGQISSTGNITGGNLSVPGGTVSSLTVSATGNIRGGNLVTPGFITATGNITGGNVDTGNIHAGNVNVDSVVSAQGNVYGDTFVGNGLVIFGNASLGNTSVSGTIGATVISASGNVIGGNLLTTGKVSASGNVSGNYFVGNGALLTGITVSAGSSLLNGNSNVVVATNGNVTVGVSGISNIAQFANTGAYVTGVISATGNIAGSYLLGNGAFITGLPAGYSNTDVAAFLPTYSGNLPNLTGLVSTTGNISGNYFIGNGSLLTGVTASGVSANALTGNTLSSNVLNSSLTSVGTLSNLSVTGNTTSGNLSTGGLISATGNITGSNLLTAGLISATANVTAGNINTAGLITATGNVSGNYFIGNGSQLTDVAASSVNANALIGNTLSSNVLNSSLTSVGNLVSLSIVGNTTAGNLLTGGLISATGNITSAANILGGNVVTGGLISASGNATVGNLSTAGLITATGNISGNNIFATGLASVTGNVIAGNINTGAIRPVSGPLTITTASGNLNLQPAGNIVLANTYINSVAYPAQDTDAATKLYVDNMVSTAIAYHTPVYATTTTTLASSTGGTITYAQPNGVANGVGATLTTTGSFNLIDTSNVQTLGTRILVKDQADAVQNGIYTWANATAIVRATDADEYGPDSSQQISLNDYFFTSTGNVNVGAAFIVNAPLGTITFGTSNITFALFSQTTAYTANVDAGLSLTGTVFSAKVDLNTTAFDAGGNIIVKAGANLTTPNIGAATGASLSLIGNVNSGNVNISGLISATGNITSAANVTGGNILTGGSISATGNITADYFSGNGAGLSNVVASGGVGNTITLGTPTDGSLTANVAYPGWTTDTFVTDGLDDLNQVSLNIANSTYVGNAYIIANVYSGPSPLTVAFTSFYIGNPNSFLWQFGDGTANATTDNAVHTFSNTLGGTFTVNFTAFNTNGTYNGNAANGAKGSTSSANISNIVLYTPSPIPSFTLSSNSFNTGNTITITNTSEYVVWYDLSFGDGTANFSAGPGLGNTSFTNVTHQYNSVSSNADSLYSAVLSGTSNTAGPSNVTVVSSASNVKVFAPQTGNVFVTANRANVINGLGGISFRNDSNGTPGNTASFGAQQLYNFNYGDGNISNVNVGTGIAGNPAAANVTNTFVLSAANQAGNVYQQFTANLYLYTGYSSSPAQSGNITITIEPQVRGNYIGTTANVVTDATANTGNAKVGYLYTDYNTSNRSTFTFQNTSQNSNLANWSWGDSTFSNGVSNVGNTLHTYNSTGAFTVALTANGTPNGITNTAQSNTISNVGYIFIAANPTAPTNLSGFSNLAIANASQGTSPLLAAGATDASGGNIVANGVSVTRFATTTPIVTAANIINANTGISSTQLTANLFAYVNNAAAGNVTFSNVSNTVGTSGALVITQDRDLHVANAAVPSYFYKVFNANISCALSSLSTGYNNYKLVDSVTGNTNYVGFVKDNLNSAPSLITAGTTLVEATAGTYRYISGIPYYNTGSPTITIATLAVANLSGQTFRSADPFVLASGTVIEGSGAILSATQTKALGTINNAGNSFLTGANLNANVGVGSSYTLGNLTANLTGANNSVATLQANIFNVIGTSATVQLPANIQMHAGANSGINEQAITCTPTANTQAAIRIVMSTAGNTPVFSNSTNFYTANAWSGVQTIAGTPEAVVRYGVLKQYAVDLSTGYLPVGPNLSVIGGRTSTQYFTFAFARPSLANFDIRLTTTTGVAGVWLAAPGTTIDKSGFSSPTPGFPGPTSTINGWLEASTQYAGSGVPGAATGTGGNGSDGCAVTGADVIPLNTAISNVAYTMTLGSQNAANSTGTNILIRIALAAGQSITDLQIGVAS